MNSVSKHLSYETIIANMALLKGKNKDIYLVVEGNDDINLFSGALNLDKSHFIDCNGKEKLDAVYARVPTKEIDERYIFLRDADFDEFKSKISNGIALFVSDCYDFEMSVLHGRLYAKIISDFQNKKANKDSIEESWKLLCNACSYIGALKKYAKDNNLPLKFSGLEFNFVNKRTLDIDIKAMVEVVYQRTEGMKYPNLDKILPALSEIVSNYNFLTLVSGKNVLQLIGEALSRHFRCEVEGKWNEDSLSRTLRIAVGHDDIKSLKFYHAFSKHVAESKFVWNGRAL